MPTTRTLRLFVPITLHVHGTTSADQVQADLGDRLRQISTQLSYRAEIANIQVHTWEEMVDAFEDDLVDAMRDRIDKEVEAAVRAKLGETSGDQDLAAHTRGMPYDRALAIKIFTTELEYDDDMATIQRRAQRAITAARLFNLAEVMNDAFGGTDSQATNFDEAIENATLTSKD